MNSKSFSKIEAIKFGWQIMKSNFIFFAGLLAFVFVLNSFPDAIANSIKSKYYFLSGIIFILGGILSIITSIGLIDISLKVYNNQKPKILDLFSSYRLFFKYFFGLILYILIVLVGLVLFIIPGIILAIRLYFFSYLIVDKKIGPIKAIKESFKITKKNTWNLFLFLSVISFLNFIILVPFSLLMLIVVFWSLNLLIVPKLVIFLFFIFAFLFLIIGLLTVTPTIIMARVFVFKKLISFDNSQDLKVEYNKENLNY